MNCMRINCAHDDADTWVRMIEHLRRAQELWARPACLYGPFGPEAENWTA